MVNAKLITQRKVHKIKMVGGIVANIIVEVGPNTKNCLVATYKLHIFISEKKRHFSFKYWFNKGQYSGQRIKKNRCFKTI